MASSRGEGLHIVLIVFVILFVAAGVTAFLMYQMATSEKQLKETAQKKLKESDDTKRRLVETQSKMRVLVGYPDVKDDAALKLMDEEIQPYVKDRSNKTYREAIQALRDRAERAEDNYDRAEQSRKKLLIQIEAAEDARQKLVAQFKASADQANGRIRVLDEDLRKAREDFVSTNDKLSQEAQKAREQLRQFKRDMGRKEKDFAFKVNRLQQIIDGLRGRIRRAEVTDLQNPDGKIVRSVTSQGYVLVNLGSDHKLRPGFPLTVYGVDERGSPYHDPKAKIEVQQIQGPRLCLAKIVEQRPGDPIVKGDPVYSPLIDSGGWRERFALAGSFDIDGDGVDDRGFLKKLIRKADGILDAELDAEGNSKGKITVDTNWLILGVVDEKKLEAAKDEERDKLMKVMAKMTDMRTEANQLNVPIINLRNFLNHMGYRSRKRLLVAGAEPD